MIVYLVLYFEKIKHICYLESVVDFLWKKNNYQL